jgi:hypothetical protein
MIHYSECGNSGILSADANIHAFSIPKADISLVIYRGVLASFENRKFCIKSNKFCNKIKQNTIAKKYRYIGIIGIFSGIGFRFFSNTATAYMYMCVYLY